MPASAPSSRPWLWPLILFLASVVLVLALWAARGWIWLGVPPINAERTPFSDTIAHLESAPNCANGLGEWYGRACFVPSIDSVPRMQTYEPWLSFHRWGLDSVRPVPFIAVGMIVLLCLAWTLTARPASAREAAIAFALFATPAVQLAVERGNFDLLIAAMLCLAGAALARPARLTGVAAALLLSLATMLKLYTGLATAAAWTITRAHWRFMLPVCAVAVILAVAVVGPRELLVLGQGAPEGATRFSTGARWLFLNAGAGAGLTALALFVATVAAGLAYQRRIARLPAWRWPRRAAAFQIAFLTAVPLFFLKDSYDYRLVLWLPCLALALAWLRPGAVDAHWRRLALAMLALFAIVATVEWPAFWLDRLGQAGHGAWTGPLTSALVYGKQFAAWLLAAVLSLVFVSLRRECWRRR